MKNLPRIGTVERSALELKRTHPHWDDETCIALARSYHYEELGQPVPVASRAAQLATLREAINPAPSTGSGRGGGE